MKLKIQHAYLTLPVRSDAAVKKLVFRRDGHIVYDLDIRPSADDPDFTAYIDLSRFIGQELEMTGAEEVEAQRGEADRIREPEYLDEPHRPQLHYTVPYGWNNDPNGMCFYDGLYHMFYQYNPCGTGWGNMHWGHATSEDLLHWETQATAIFPDADGTAFSGSAIADERNVTGLGDRPLLLYYTAAPCTDPMAAGRSKTQCLVYTEDGFTFTKHTPSPLIPTMTDENRDPKVVWVAEIGRYVMALYLDGHTYRLMTSTDLLHWETMQDFVLGDDRECPDLMPFTLDGERIWVLAGASDRYVAGRFTQEGFQPLDSVRRLAYDSQSYAGQSLSGVGDRVLKLYWDRMAIPSASFTQQMSIPMELHLEKAGGAYLLSALPIPELDRLRKVTVGREDFTVEEPFRLKLGANPADVEVVLPAVPEGVFRLTLFGQEIKADLAANTVQIGEAVLPLYYAPERRDVLTLRVIADRCSFEVFTDGGRHMTTRQVECDYRRPWAELSADRPLRITRFEGRAFRSIYE